MHYYIQFGPNNEVLSGLASQTEAPYANAIKVEESQYLSYGFTIPSIDSPKLCVNIRNSIETI